MRLYIGDRGVFVAKNDGGMGKRIRELRKTLGMSQDKFAKGIKVSRSYIGTLEIGVQEINDRIASIICMTYNVNENWLREGKGPMRDKIIDKQLEKVMTDFKRLDVLFQQYIVKQIELLNDIQDKQRLKK